MRIKLSLNRTYKFLVYNNEQLDYISKIYNKDIPENFKDIFYKQKIKAYKNILKDKAIFVYIEYGKIQYNFQNDKLKYESNTDYVYDMNIYMLKLKLKNIKKI